MRSTADGQHLSRLFSFNLGTVQFMDHDLYSKTKTVTDRNLLRQILNQNNLATYSIKVRVLVSLMGGGGVKIWNANFIL